MERKRVKYSCPVTLFTAFTQTHDSWPGNSNDTIMHSTHTHTRSVHDVHLYNVHCTNMLDMEDGETAGETFKVYRHPSTLAQLHRRLEASGYHL